MLACPSRRDDGHARPPPIGAALLVEAHTLNQHRVLNFLGSPSIMMNLCKFAGGI
jgi:hypothetical protein